MGTWAAFLRGVNVGNITVRSAPLRDCLTGIGLADVRTVLATGNAVFESARSRQALKHQIEQALRDTFGYDAWIVLLDAAQTRAAIDSCPLSAKDGWHTYFILGSDDEVLADLARQAPADEPTASGPHVLYWQVAEGQTLKTPFAKTLARAKYKPSITTRNLRTMQKVEAAL